VVGTVQQTGDFFGAELAHHLARRADDQRMVGKDLALGDQGVGADDAALADHRMVEQHRTDADQRAVADRAAVQHHQVADGDVAADRQRHAFVGVQHELSWMLLFSPMLIGSLSPRSVAFHQIEAFLARRTSPMTIAFGATQLCGSSCGRRAPRA
jgi:hypothetical protein